MSLEIPDAADQPCALLCVTEEGDLVSASLSNPGSDGTRGVFSVRN